MLEGRARTCAGTPGAPSSASRSQRDTFAEACSCEFILGGNFDFKAWLAETLVPWEHSLRAVRRLRKVMVTRAGGWSQLAADMERGPEAFADVLDELTKPSQSH